MDQRWYPESPRAPFAPYDLLFPGIMKLSGMVWGGGMLGDVYLEKAIARYHVQSEII